MKVLYSYYDYEDSYTYYSSIKDELVDEFSKIIESFNYNVVGKSNDLETSLPEKDPIELLKTFLLPICTKKQAENAWKKSKKTKEYYDKLAVTWSGTITAADYLTIEEYVKYRMAESRANARKNKKVVDLIERLS